jgi:hypothetical protein
MRMAASRGRRILFNQDDDEEDEDEVNIVTHEVDEEADDDDEEDEETESEDEEEEDHLDHEHDSDIEGEEVEQQTADSDDDDDAGEDIHDWNDEDDDVPDLIRIHDGGEGGCLGRSSVSGAESSSRTSSRNGNGHGSNGVSSNGHASRSSHRHGSAVAGMTALSVEEDGDGNEEEGSPARKNPRCTVSPTATCLPLRLSSQALSMDVVENVNGHNGESSSSNSSGGVVVSVENMDISAQEDDSADSSAAEMAL